ncbi:MAG: hypothetical protein ACKV2U_02040 [Bryobacteraceae bacterium]
MISNCTQGNCGTPQEYRPDVIRGGGPRPAQGPDRQVRAAKVELSSEQTRTLELTTADGDTVSISIETSAQLEAGGFYAKGPNGRIRGGSISGDVSVSVSVQVEGDLDDQEVAEIKDLLRELVTSGKSDELEAAPPVSPGDVPVNTTGEVPPEPTVEAPPVDPNDAPPVDPPVDPNDAPPIEQQGLSSIASYAYSYESQVSANFSRLHNRATWG